MWLLSHLASLVLVPWRLVLTTRLSSSLHTQMEAHTHTQVWLAWSLPFT